jgi:hypothetical protein
MQPRVLGLIHHAHPTAAQFFEDAVVRNGLRDHWTEILGPGLGQVNENVELGVYPEASKQLQLNIGSSSQSCAACIAFYLRIE